MSNIGILGGGTWGTALGVLLHQAGHHVTLWSALPEEVSQLTKTRRHPNLPGLVIPEGIRFTEDIAQAVQGMEAVVFAVPSPFVRETARKAAPLMTDGQIAVDVAKGMEADTLLTMTQVIEDEIRNPNIKTVALSGPTHAEEVALGLPTTIVSACECASAARRVQDLFTTDTLRVYTNADKTGVELSGAMKNIIALAAGISAGLGFGDNAKAAIITRGMVEITRLGLCMGCQESTFAGLAGIGDLIVTCTSLHSRNNRCGMLLGKGVPPTEAIARVGMVVEGIHALPAAMRLMERYQVDMPIVRAVNAVVFEQADPMETVTELMRRDRKTEAVLP
ncbi:MAG: NAD(P)-dependent glycerol-3-phosphate dehydrogenase [Clostridiales bacterium]|nr:NAD(P)-dependent glycerol-3-phosphate dehydrogenase [Clostridiales bacterium]